MNSGWWQEEFLFACESAAVSNELVLDLLITDMSITDPSYMNSNGVIVTNAPFSLLKYCVCGSIKSTTS